jgi:hypothetical protein
MDPTSELAAKLDRDRFEAAEAMTLEQRAEMSLVLFDLMCESLRAGFSILHPQASQSQVHDMLLKRLRDFKRQEQGW